jgi:hypothetical protein
MILTISFEVRGDSPPINTNDEIGGPRAERRNNDIRVMLDLSRGRT